MSQPDIYNFLKKKDKWFTSKELSKELNLGRVAVNINLGKMYRCRGVFPDLEFMKGKQNTLFVKRKK